MYGVKLLRYELIGIVNLVYRVVKGDQKPIRQFLIVIIRVIALHPTRTLRLTNYHAGDKAKGEDYFEPMYMELIQNVSVLH